MRFEWNEDKNDSNREKHGVWFEEASTIFLDTYSRVFLDQEHSEDEERFIIIGASSTSGKVLLVVHCYRDDDEIIRIISARKANKKERSWYEG